VVPHLHWHLVARFDADAQFPAPIWAPAVRPDDAAQLQRLRAALPALDAALAVAAAATPT
jgi:diadenosine tetraphosphate (Ap4A) HIT family hydrolase